MTTLSRFVILLVEDERWGVIDETDDHTAAAVYVRELQDKGYAARLVDTQEEF